MPAPLIAKVDRLAANPGDIPGRFFDILPGLPGLEAAHFLVSPTPAAVPQQGEQRVGVWLWRGREGMREGHAALADAMGHVGPPPMIEERVLDVVTVEGEATGKAAVVVHLGPFPSAAHREAHLANGPRVHRALQGMEGNRGVIVLADPACRDLVVVHFWDAAPEADAVRAAIAALPVAPGFDASLLTDPSYVETFDVLRSIRPAVAA
ncbi:MAG TPA: hypothetical protein VFO60_10320 [Candidatus Dormibacteraeota bacterium]|nr:hypothetical protein [Candidatus Dormibacteraeota bacterium]